MAMDSTPAPTPTADTLHTPAAQVAVAPANLGTAVGGSSADAAPTIFLPKLPQELAAREAAGKEIYLVRGPQTAKGNVYVPVSMPQYGLMETGGKVLSTVVDDTDFSMDYRDALVAKYGEAKAKILMKGIAASMRRFDAAPITADSAKEPYLASLAAKFDGKDSKDFRPVYDYNVKKVRVNYAAVIPAKTELAGAAPQTAAATTTPAAQQIPVVNAAPAATPQAAAPAAAAAPQAAAAEPAKAAAPKKHYNVIRTVFRAPVVLLRGTGHELGKAGRGLGILQDHKADAAAPAAPAAAPQTAGTNKPAAAPATAQPVQAAAQPQASAAPAATTTAAKPQPVGTVQTPAQTAPAAAPTTFGEQTSSALQRVSNGGRKPAVKKPVVAQAAAAAPAAAAPAAPVAATPKPTTPAADAKKQDAAAEAAVKAKGDKADAAAAGKPVTAAPAAAPAPVAAPAPAAAAQIAQLESEKATAVADANQAKGEATAAKNEAKAAKTKADQAIANAQKAANQQKKQNGFMNWMIVLGTLGGLIAGGVGGFFIGRKRLKASLKAELDAKFQEQFTAMQQEINNLKQELANRQPAAVQTPAQPTVAAPVVPTQQINPFAHVGDDGWDDFAMPAARAKATSADAEAVAEEAPVAAVEHDLADEVIAPAAFEETPVAAASAIDLEIADIHKKLDEQPAQDEWEPLMDRLQVLLQEKNGTAQDEHELADDLAETATAETAAPAETQDVYAWHDPAAEIAAKGPDAMYDFHDVGPQATTDVAPVALVAEAEPTIEEKMAEIRDAIQKDDAPAGVEEAAAPVAEEPAATTDSKTSASENVRKRLKRARQFGPVKLKLPEPRAYGPKSAAAKTPAAPEEPIADQAFPQLQEALDQIEANRSNADETSADEAGVEKTVTEAPAGVPIGHGYTAETLHPALRKAWGMDEPAATTSIVDAPVTTAPEVAMEEVAAEPAEPAAKKPFTYRRLGELVP